MSIHQDIHADVCIVGSGPIGLTLAMGLSLAGVKDIIVVDRSQIRDSHDKRSKALSMNAGSLESFRLYGLADRFRASGQERSTAHFAAGTTPLQLNHNVLGLTHSVSLAIPQYTTTRVLLEACLERGIRLIESQHFTDLQQHPDHVIAHFVDTPADHHANPSPSQTPTLTIQTSWLIGCDSTRSAVRAAAALSSDYTPPTFNGWLADGYIDRTITGYHGARTAARITMLTACGDGSYRLVGFAPHSADGSGPEAVRPTSDADVRARARQAFDGQDYGFHNMTWSSAFGNSSGVAPEFRKHRVFLAGDAAHHFFPAGGQGMNTGIQDAVNLAWKLACVITGKITEEKAVERVLDSYSAERVAAAREVIRNVDIQMEMMVGGAPGKRALAEFAAEALLSEPLNRLWTRRVSGLGDPIKPYQRHARKPDGGAGEPEDALVGTRLTHVLLEDEDVRLRAIRGNQLLLLVFANKSEDEGTRGTIAEVAGKYEASTMLYQGEVQTSDAKWDDVISVLIRPDQRVAWTASKSQHASQIQASLEEVLLWWSGHA